jgi:hypothetical protein
MCRKREYCHCETQTQCHFCDENGTSRLAVTRSSGYAAPQALRLSVTVFEQKPPKGTAQSTLPAVMLPLWPGQVGVLLRQFHGKSTLKSEYSG